MVFIVFLFDCGTVQTVWYLLFFYLIVELFRQCGIYCLFIVFLFDCGTVQTVWYLLFFYLIVELFRQCGIYCFSI